MSFQRIVFAQGDDAIEPLEILDNQGDDAAIEYLSQWDTGEGQVSEKPSNGSSDYVVEKDGYRLSYNLRLGYIGLERIVPDQDIYENVTTVNKVVSESSNLTAAALAKAVADLRAWWNRPYRVDTDVVSVYLGSDRTATLIPFCRANTILMKAVGMKPNSKFYTFFDDTDVAGFVSGAVKLTRSEEHTSELQSH